MINVVEKNKREREQHCWGEKMTSFDYQEGLTKMLICEQKSERKEGSEPC